MADAALSGLGEEFAQFWSMLGALADDPVPAGLIGLVPVGCAVGSGEYDGLDAGGGLAPGVLLVLLGEQGRGFSLEAFGGSPQDRFLRIAQAIPGGLVHQHRDLGAVEPGID